MPEKHKKIKGQPKSCVALNWDWVKYWWRLKGDSKNNFKCLGLQWINDKFKF